MIRRRAARAGAGGFTLVELLVVLLILASLFGAAQLAGLGVGRHHGLRGEAERLAALIELLSEQAVLDGREYGLLLDNDRYRVLGYEEASGLWQPVPGERVHPLPDGIGLELQLEGLPLRLAGAAESSATPQLLILSSGELSPFQLQLREPGGGAVWRLASDGFQLPRAQAVAEAP